MRGPAERRGAERLAALLERNGDVPTVDAELADLLTRVRALRGLPPTRDLDTATRDRMRRRLVAVAAVRPAPSLESAPVRRPVPARRRWWPHRAVLAGSAVAVVLAATGVGVASTGAMPGNPLYGIKRGTESARLATAGSGTARGQLLLEFAGTRLTEAGRAGDGAQAVAALRAMDAQTVAGVRLLDMTAVEGRNAHPLDVVEDFLARQRPHVVTMLADEPAPQARAAAAAALALLDRVQGRVEALKDSLSCAAPGGTISTDDLGPLLIPCGTPAPGGATAPTAAPAPTAPSAPATANPSRPASPAPTGSAAPTTSPTPPPGTTPTPTPSRTATPTASPSPSTTPTPTASPTLSPTAAPTATPSASGESPTAAAAVPTARSEPPSPVGSISSGRPDPAAGGR